VQELESAVQQLRAERTRADVTTATPGLAPTALPMSSATQPATGAAPTPSPGAPGTDAGSPPGMAEDITLVGDGGHRILAGWSDEEGFFIRSADGNFRLRMTGQIQGDYRAFLDGGDYTDVTTFLVRRARLGIEADMFKNYEFRLLPDFGEGTQQTSPGSERIQDAYINIRYWDAFQVEGGKFKQPVSYEQLVQDRFVPTAERSMFDQLVPQRDEGIMIHGQKLFGDRLDYAVAVSNGEINGDFDSNGLKDVNARVVVRPWNGPALWEPLRGLQIGVSGGSGVEQESFNPTPLRTPAMVPWLVFNATDRANGIRWRLDPEAVYFYGPFGIAAEYYREQQRISPSAGSPFVLDVPFTGFYVMSTFLLTGEARTTYSQPIIPLHNFDPCHPLQGMGAWELVGRVSRLDVGGEVFEPLRTGKTTITNLADPAGNSRGATEMTLGYNWYFNAWVRLQFNWEHAWFDQPVRLGPGPEGVFRHQDSLIARLQVIF
jgi:phosphate-selective porin OprO/OprP